MTQDAEQACTAYARFLESLSADGLSELDRYVTESVHFRDPFNDVHGIEKMRKICADMFADIDELLFVVTDSAYRDNVGWLQWRMSGRIRRLPGRTPWSIEGVTRLIFAADGRVAEHLDYWDAAGGIYERVPVLGRALRFIRRRLSVE